MGKDVGLVVKRRYALFHCSSTAVGCCLTTTSKWKEAYHNRQKTKMCTECGQRDFGHELINVKIKSGELNYALNSFPRNKNVIYLLTIVCSCCSSVGFGCNSQLTRIKDEHLFFVDGDDVEGIDREISEWEIDHTPDCKGAGCYDISILLTRDELEYACHAMGKSSTCLI